MQVQSKSHTKLHEFYVQLINKLVADNRESAIPEAVAEYESLSGATAGRRTETEDSSADASADASTWTMSAENTVAYARV